MKTFPDVSGRTSTIPSTSVKNEFGRVLDQVLQGRVVVITKHDTPKAVMLSVEEYAALTSASRPDLDALTDEFDAMLARMQSTKARTGMKAAFNASPKKLGKAAVTAARKRA